MNIIKLSYSNLRYRALAGFFNVLVLSLGIATIVTLLHIGKQVEQRFGNDLKGIDLVVGAKGSPIQLILSSVFHLDIPNGNIPLAEADKIKANHMVKSAIPVALGDNYQGFHIVGTTPDYISHYSAEFETGGLWTEPMQAVIGSEVARSTHLGTGGHFAGSHGLTSGGEEHAEFPYAVVGILKPTGTVIDRLVLTDVESVWNIHEHHHHDADDHDEDEEDHGQGREITALLVTYASPAAAVTMPRMVNSTGALQAASPAFETARLLKMLGVGSDTVRAFGALLVLIAGFGFFVTLFNAVNERRYDIALIRSLGATRSKVFCFILIESMTLGLMGAFFGIVFGHMFSCAAEMWVERTRHMSLASAGFMREEAYLVLLAFVMSFIAGVIPAAMAYKVNVAKILTRGA